MSISSSSPLSPSMMPHSQSYQKIIIDLINFIAKLIIIVELKVVVNFIIISSDSDHYTKSPGAKKKLPSAPFVAPEDKNGINLICKFCHAHFIQWVKILNDIFYFLVMFMSYIFISDASWPNSSHMGSKVFSKKVKC